MFLLDSNQKNMSKKVDIIPIPTLKRGEFSNQRRLKFREAKANYILARGLLQLEASQVQQFQQLCEQLKEASGDGSFDGTSVDP